MDPIYSTPKVAPKTVPQKMANIWEHFQYRARRYLSKDRLLQDWYDELKANYEYAGYGDYLHFDGYERINILQTYMWMLEHHLHDMLLGLNVEQTSGLLKMQKFSIALGKGIARLEDHEKEKLENAIANIVYTDPYDAETTGSLLEQLRNRGYTDLVNRAMQRLYSRLEALDTSALQQWLDQHLYTVEIANRLLAQVTPEYPNIHAALQSLGHSNMDEKRQAYIARAIPEKSELPRAQDYANPYKQWWMIPGLRTAAEQYRDWLNAALKKQTFRNQNMSISAHPQLTYRMVECYQGLDVNTQQTLKNIYDMTLALYGIYDNTHDQNVSYDKLSGVNIGSMPDAVQLGWLIGRHLRDQSVPMDLVSSKTRQLLSLYVDLNVPISIASVQDIEHWCNMLEPKALKEELSFEL